MWVTLHPFWTFFTSFAWDLALNVSEMAVLGRHHWYWRLHVNAARLYWNDPAVRVVLREAPDTRQPEGQCVYGETPALSFLAMLRQVNIEPDDVLFDLGCGRGLALLSAALAYQVRAVGVDVLPTFIERARQIAKRLHIDDRVSLTNGDFLEQDMSSGTIFYAAATTFVRDVIDDLAERVVRQTANSGRVIRFITLSQTLLPPWKLVAKARYPMTWGWNTVYFHVKE